MAAPTSELSKVIEVLLADLQKLLDRNCLPRAKEIMEQLDNVQASLAQPNLYILCISAHTSEGDHR
jgi:hypothetical protein